MSEHFQAKLQQIETLLQGELDSEAVVRIWGIMGGSGLEPADLENGMLYSETLPKGREPGFTARQRHLHFLWDAFDRLPLSLLVQFSIPFRRMIAGQLFQNRGAAFVCEENVRFNFGQYLSVGENVFFNRGVFIDSKGGVTIGDSVCLTEYVRIFSHGHSEHSHMTRSYSPVVIGDHAKVYTGAEIMPGVTIGAEAIVASGALVNKDVPPGMVVAGSPARVIRQRRHQGRHGDELDHIWLF